MVLLRLIDESPPRLVYNEEKANDLYGKHLRMIGKPKKDPLKPFEREIIYLGRGSRSALREIGHKYKCDYGLFSHLYTPTTHPSDKDRGYNPCHNLLATETKHTGSFNWQGLLGQTNDRNSHHWDPVRQVIWYGKFSGSSSREFVYLLTNEELLVMKLRFHDKEAAKATGKNVQGSQPSSRDRGAKAVNMRDEKQAQAGCSVKYKRIEWVQNWDAENLKAFKEGKGGYGPMTINLAIFWLAWKAAFGDDEDYDTPPASNTRSQTATATMSLPARPKKQGT